MCLVGRPTLSTGLFPRVALKKSYALIRPMMTGWLQSDIAFVRRSIARPHVRDINIVIDRAIPRIACVKLLSIFGRRYARYGDKSYFIIPTTLRDVIVNRDRKTCRVVAWSYSVGHPSFVQNRCLFRLTGVLHTSTDQLPYGGLCPFRAKDHEALHPSKDGTYVPDGSVFSYVPCRYICKVRRSSLSQTKLVWRLQN